ncbi:MAG TPA: hypothetical protein VIO14_03805 [Dehalococcoidia bacterium]
MTSVVIVEPDALLGRLLWAFLASHGFRAWTVPTVEEARRRCSAERVDVLVLDLDGLDGADLQETLGSLPPAVILAGPSERKGLQPRLRARVLSKPFDPDELLLLMGDAAERARASPEV